MTSWPDYIHKNQYRTPRPLFKQGLELFHSREIEAATKLKSAIDLGCGPGVEAVQLIQAGWNVFAYDKSLESMKSIKNLLGSDCSQSNWEFFCGPFEAVTSLPFCDFLFAYHSLPFCHRDYFASLWSMIEQAICPQGFFVGSFFGLKDEWAGDGKLVGLSEEEVRALLRPFKILYWKEFDGVAPTTLSGPKHWHFYEVIACKN